MKLQVGLVLGLIVVALGVTSALLLTGGKRAESDLTDYVGAVQRNLANGSISMDRALGDSCNYVTWRYYQFDGQDLVEVNADLKTNGQAVVIRWRVAKAKDQPGQVLVGEPVFASLGMEKFRQPRDIFARIGVPASDRRVSARR